MSHQLDDLVRHNTWANRVLFEFAFEQRPETLDLHILPGGFGTILETFRHIVNSEGSYLRRLSASWAEVPWDMSKADALTEVREHHNLVAEEWEKLLASDYDQMTPARAFGDGMVFHVTHGIVLTQAIHHGSEHCAQICDIYGFHGITPPDIGSWDYGLATGRSWVIEE